MSGPHLALPLLAGVARVLPGWKVHTWDLSAEFYHQNAAPPTLKGILARLSERDFSSLDELYFTWEDTVQRAALGNLHGGCFRLLSGFSFPELVRVPRLSNVMDCIRAEGTVFTRYYKDSVIPALIEEHPAVIAVSISSSNQLLAAAELLSLIRQHIPETFILVGGNVATRLRETTALEVLVSLSDQLVLFQGEIAFHHVLQTIADVGTTRARQIVPKIAGDQLIPSDRWPTPSFAGVCFDRICGLPTVPYVSTRGCYWGRCRFCAIPAGWAVKGYAGSTPMSFVAQQLQGMLAETGIARIKFVDESMAPDKVRDACRVFPKAGLHIEWEAYARMEPAWEDIELLEQAHGCGLRKLYFGLEQALTASRELMNKQDRGNPLRILRACQRAGIAVHLFCMVGYPGTSRQDAELTTRFLLENQDQIDTADLVGFRLDIGTNVPGIHARIEDAPDWALTLPYEPISDDVLSPDNVAELERVCQETLWEEAPRLLHPLFRLVTPWTNPAHSFNQRGVHLKRGTRACSANS